MHYLWYCLLRMTSSFIRYRSGCVCAPSPAPAPSWRRPGGPNGSGRFGAENGRSNGGVIQVSGKSGANQLHGSLFEFFRNEAPSTRNLFAVAGPKPGFRRNLYGVAFGGPVKKNRAFFFVDWQGTRLRTGVTRFSAVPASQRQRALATAITDPTGCALRTPFPNRTIPAGRFDSFAQRLPSRYQAFNVGNTPPLGQPNRTFGSAAFGGINTAALGAINTAAFGGINTAGDPRVFEVLKVKF